MTIAQPGLEQSEWNSWLIKYQLGLAPILYDEELTERPAFSSPSIGPQCSLGDMMVRDKDGRLVSSLDFFVKEGYLASPPALAQHRRLRDLALLRHNLDQSFGNKTLDAHCKQTKALFRAQFSAISLAQVDPEFMQVMGATGSGLEEIVKAPLPRSSSLCSHAFLLGERTAVIHNRSKDWRLRKFQFGPHPDYHQQPPLGFNFYASAPVMLTAPSLDVNEDGMIASDVKVQVGRLCVLDFDAREDFGEVEVAQLEAMASMASDAVQREWESQRASKLMSMQFNINRLTAAFHSKFLSTNSTTEEDDEMMEKKMNGDMQSLFQMACDQIREQLGAASVVCFGPPLRSDVVEEEAMGRRKSMPSKMSNRFSSAETHITNDGLRRNSLLTQGSSIQEANKNYIGARRKGKSQICVCARAGSNVSLREVLDEEQEDAVEAWLDKYADPTRADRQRVMAYRSESLRKTHANRYQDNHLDHRDYEAGGLTCLLPDQEAANFIMAPIMTLDKRRTAYAILVHWSKETLFEEWDRTFLLSSISILQSASIRMSAIESDNARMKFMRLVSHELRTPLHGIIGMSSQLQHCLDGEGSQMGGSHSGKATSVDGEAIWLSKSIQYAGEDLQKMLDDMLVCGRSSVGLPTNTIESTEKRDSRLVQLIESCCQKQLQASITRRRHADYTYGSASDTAIPPLVIVKLDIESELIKLNRNVDKAEIVFDQFISNALRFRKQSNEGGQALVEISIGPVREEGATSIVEQDGNRARLKVIKDNDKVRDKEDSSAKVQVTIRDNGIGMSESFLKHFAEPFKKADSFHQGAGVGAAVGISALNELGGTVSVYSVLGQGTTIRMIIKGDLSDEEVTKEIVPKGGRLSCCVLSSFSNVAIKRYLEEQFALRYVQLDTDSNNLRGSALMLYFLESGSEASLEHFRRVSSGLHADQRVIVATLLLETEIAELQQSGSIQCNPNTFYISNPWIPSALDNLEAFLQEIRGGKSAGDPTRRQNVPASPTSKGHYTEITLTKSSSGSHQAIQQQLNEFNSISSKSTTKMVRKSARPSTAPPVIVSDNSATLLPPNTNLPPLRQISSPAPSLPNTLEDDTDGFSVLLVEDNPINMRLLEACVKKIKCRYLKAFDGLEAVEKFKAMSPYGPSVVLLDISLPFLDGLQACKQMRAYLASSENSLRRAYVVAITALSSEEDVQKGLECGVDEWRVKPANLPKLTLDLKEWQRKWQQGIPLIDV